MGEEPNHTTARKPGPLENIQNSLFATFPRLTILDGIRCIFYSVNACSEQMLALKDHKRPGVSVNIIPEGSDGTTGRWWQEMMFSFMKKAYGQKLQY